MKELAARASGIYAIRHIASERLYIGSAVYLKQRRGEHISRLRAGSHDNAKLQRAWLKHGEPAFEFMVVQVVPQKEELIFWEQFWIDRLSPWFNILRVAGSSLGSRRTPEFCARQSAQRKGLKAPPHVAEMLRSMNRGTKASPERVEKIAAALRGRKLSPEHRAKSGNGKAKIYQFISPSGDLVEVINLNAFCRENGLTQSNMHAVHSGKANSCKGWRAASE